MWQKFVFSKPLGSFPARLNLERDLLHVANSVFVSE